MKAIFLFAAAALVAPSVAVAGTSGDEDGQKDKMICKAQKETGSRLGGKKICMTRAQWDEHRRNTQADIERSQTQQVNKQGS